MKERPHRLDIEKTARVSAYVSRNWDDHLTGKTAAEIRDNVQQGVGFPVAEVTVKKVLKALGKTSAKRKRVAVANKYREAQAALFRDYAAFCEEMGRQIPEEIKVAIG